MGACVRRKALMQECFVNLLSSSSLSSLLALEEVKEEIKDDDNDDDDDEREDKRMRDKD